uniref:RNA polymerase II-associated protein 1 N-terminal domain-containing protein n=1 Tax=Panagrolaimus sp. ES5 TaxID=591445 RepID=A0AC34F9H3_9BILA
MEELQSDYVSSIRENFPGFFEKKDEVYPFVFDFNGKDSAEDGFPEVLDLSAFFIPKEDGLTTHKVEEGKSIFATAFKNKNFKDEEMDTQEISENDIEAENMRRIKNMTSEDITAAREEILERFDPSIIEFLKQRKANETKVKTSAAAGDISKFRLKRMEGETETSKKNEEIIEPINEEVKNLEFFNFDDPSGSEENAKFSRLAMNAVQMDLASKSYGLTAPRQQTAWISIFDKLAASTLVSENKTKLEFAADVKPASDGSWMFVPIRRVLDAVEDKRPPSPDDAEIIRLTFLFSVLFLKRQSTLMHMFGSPSDALCCVAEVFLLGPEIYHDNIIDKAITVLLDEYFIPYGEKGKLAFAATKPIARLDAFLPFYYDLMKKYEQYGGGCSNFSRTLFMMACMNSVSQDALLLLLNVWDPGCAIVRQCDISSSHMQPLLHYLINTRKANHFFVESELFLQYGRLLTLYAVAIRDEKVLRQRNPGLFNLAATEIGEFIKFWKTSKQDDIARREEVSFLSEKLTEATSPFINF